MNQLKSLGKETSSSSVVSEKLQTMSINASKPPLGMKLYKFGTHTILPPDLLHQKRRNSTRKHQINNIGKKSVLL